MIEETDGTAAFITTPRGNNHAKTMYQRAVGNDQWFAQLSSIHETKALSAEQLAESLEEYKDLYGADLGLAMFEQEYYCSFAGAMVGAYYGSEMNSAEREGRIKTFRLTHAIRCTRHGIWARLQTTRSGAFRSYRARLGRVSLISTGLTVTTLKNG
ncbi:hypothetical protein ACQTO0_14440 [Brucella sp. NF 2815]|uniref:hypothetical protein n=1 Tax=Brucella sp. NF 2815 TaxID=3419592 RepID=UPI003D17E720